MRVLLTRAEQDADRTRKKLVELGQDVVACPVIEIVGTGAAWPLGAVDAALATSGHAFSVRTEGPTPEVRRLIPLFLVGTRTHEMAVANGFLGRATTARNAVALAAEVTRSSLRKARIVYLAGRDRKPDIETALQGAGHDVIVIEAYEARPVETPSVEATRAFRHRSVDAILHFSRRSATLLLEMASAHGLDIRSAAHFCLSEDVAAPLHDAGLDEIHVATHPSEISLLELLAEAGRDPDEDRP